MGQLSGRRVFPVAAAVFLAAYGIFLLRYTSFSVGGSDSSGYINTARRMLAGTLVGRPRALDRFGLPEAWTQTFIPLGFVAGPAPGTMAPYYPSGFPAHMLAAGQIFGWRRGPFIVSPLAAVGCLVLIYLLARELGLSSLWASGATAIFAAWPVFIGQAIQPMSDVTATFWALAAVLWSIKARRRRLWALAAGAAIGMAILVRPTNVLLAVPLAFALPMSLPALMLVGAGGLPFAAALGAYDLHCYGSALQTGYGKTGLFDAVAWKNFPPRFRHYGGWILRSLTPLVLLAWLGVTADRRAAWRDRGLLASWFATFFLFYCLYEPYDSFWFVRFLLPAAPALVIGAVIVVRDAAARLARPRLTAAVAAVLLAVVLFREGRVVRGEHILNTAQYESIYPQACAWAARRLPPEALVLSMVTSGALEHYTGLFYARWDWLDAQPFAPLRERVEQRGGRFFALLFPFEIEQFPTRVPATGTWKKIGSFREATLWELER